MPNNYVSYESQTPSENEKVQARQNIGAMGLNSFDLYMNGAVPRPPVPPFFTQRIPNIVPGYTEFELINGLNHALIIEQTARQNTDLLLKENLEKETADRIQADNQLQENINAEATARENADNQLQQNINAEATARENADTTLQNNINAEKTARENADTTLQNNINAEKTARENADTTLQNNINAEKTARENADTSLQQAITDEATARENADNQLQTKINAINAQGNVRYDVVQNLTDEQKAQARTNIGAGTGGGTATGAVLYDQAQNLTNDQKTQARKNIESVGYEIYEKGVSKTYNEVRFSGGTVNASQSYITTGGFEFTYGDPTKELKLEALTNYWNVVYSCPYSHDGNIMLTNILKIKITGEPTFTYPLYDANLLASFLGANAGNAVKKFFSGTLSITEAANVVTNCNVLEMYFLPFITSAEAGSSGSLKYKIVLEVTGASSGSTHQVGDIITLYNKLWDNSYESVSGTVSA